MIQLLFYEKNLKKFEKHSAIHTQWGYNNIIKRGSKERKKEMLKDYKVDYHLKFYDGVRYIEEDYSAEVVAADIEDAKVSFKYYIKDNTDYRLSEVKITNITEM